jgi:hypothetical protein
MKGPEPIFLKIKDILTDELAAYQDLLDLEYADWVLPEIQGYYIEDSDGPITALPAVYLQQNQDPEIVRASGSAAAGYFVDVIACDECDLQGLELLTTRLWRYQRAIGDVLRQHQYEAGYWDNLQIWALLGSPPLPGREDAVYWRAMGVRVRCQVLEDY